VQQRTPARTLKRRAGSPHLCRPARASALETAIPLTTIAPLANTHLPPATRQCATENPIPLVDHQRPARQFLDKRREPIDTVTTVARPRGAPESSDL
jgi:hypothetical protein